MTENSDVDTLAAAVAGPYGPLTRVSDIDADFPTNYNNTMRIEFTSGEGVTVFMTRRQLEDAGVQLRILQQYHPVIAKATALETQVDATDTLTAAFSSPPTYTELKAAVQSLYDIEARKGHY